MVVMGVGCIIIKRMSGIFYTGRYTTFSFVDGRVTMIGSNVSMRGVFATASRMEGT